MSRATCMEKYFLNALVYVFVTIKYNLFMCKNKGNDILLLDMQLCLCLAVRAVSFEIRHKKTLCCKIKETLFFQLNSLLSLSQCLNHLKILKRIYYIKYNILYFCILYFYIHKIIQIYIII